MNLSQAFQWVESIRPSWQPTAKGYAPLQINQRHVIKALGDISIDELTPMSFVLLQQYALSQGKSRSTANRITAVLSCTVKELVKHHLLEAEIPFTQFKEPKGKQEFYTKEEVHRLLNACYQLPEQCEMYYDLLFLAAKTGARQGELLKLTWNCIDFEDNTLTFYDTKANGDDRTLPLTPELRALLKRKWRNRVDEDFLFPINGHQALSTLRKIQKLAGITNLNKNFHTLRHTAATQLFANGAALPDVMSILGHKNERTTMRYAHATMEGKQRALQTL